MMKNEYIAPEVQTFNIALEVSVLSEFKSSGVQDFNTPKDFNWGD